MNAPPKTKKKKTSPTGPAIDLPSVLASHGAWVRGEAGGARANLTRADLSGADLSKANLSMADLSGANLSGAIIAYGWVLQHRGGA